MAEDLPYTEQQMESLETNPLLIPVFNDCQGRATASEGADYSEASQRNQMKASRILQRSQG